MEKSEVILKVIFSLIKNLKFNIFFITYKIFKYTCYYSNIILYIIILYIIKIIIILKIILIAENI